MTFAEMGVNLDLEIDESGGYWFTNSEKSYWLNKAVDDFVNKIYKKFETDEDAREKLRNLVTDSAPQASATFDLSLINNLYNILKVTGTFSVTVNGGTSTITRRIVPQQIDDLMDFDPFGKGSNGDPKYEEVSNTLQIKSDSTPLSVIVRYLKTPLEVDIDGSPASILDIPTQYHHEIVSMAKNMCLENMSSPRFPNSTAV